MEQVTLFGGTGFIGSRYKKMYPLKTIVNNRNDWRIKSPNILYMISTVDNYNVYEDPYIDIDTNLTTLIDVLEVCRVYQTNNEDDRLIFNFISSWFVYGNVPLPAREYALCDPKGFYSITKRTAEQLIISYCETFKLDYRILRLGNVLGKDDKKISKKKNALQYMINLLKEDKPVELYDGGTMVRDYIYVDDAVRAIHYLISNDLTINNIYNIGSGVGISIREAILYAHKKLDSKSEIVNIETKDFHKKVQTRDMVLDIIKLRKTGYIHEFDNIYQIIDKLLD